MYAPLQPWVHLERQGDSWPIHGGLLVVVKIAVAASFGPAAAERTTTEIGELPAVAATGGAAAAICSAGSAPVGTERTGSRGAVTGA